MFALCVRFFRKLWRRDAGQSRTRADERTIVAEWRPEIGSLPDPVLTPRLDGSHPLALQNSFSAPHVEPIACATTKPSHKRFMLAQRLQSVQVLNRGKRRRDEPLDPRGKPVVYRGVRPQPGRRIISPAWSLSIRTAETATDNIVMLPTAIKPDILKRAA